MPSMTNVATKEKQMAKGHLTTAMILFSYSSNNLQNNSTEHPENLVLIQTDFYDPLLT